MSSTFGGLARATTSLHAQQRGMDITGQNITNVNTEGYSRQRVELQSVGGAVVPAIWSRGPEIGQGVSSQQVTRIRDQFLETRAQTEHARSAQLAELSNGLTQIETAFREPGDTGIQATLAKVWQGFANVGNNPGDLGARNALLDTTRTLVGTIQTTRSSLDLQWEQTYDRLNTLVDDTNQTASSVASLNKAILAATSAGMPVNELADRRDVLVQKLATDVGATATRADDGSLRVTVGGQTLVSGDTAYRMSVAGPKTADLVVPQTTVAPPPPAPAPAAPRLVLEPGITSVDASGTARGMLDALGGAATQGTSIITYRAQLDTFARDLAKEINKAHTKGYDLDGDNGNNFLGPMPETDITAKNITLAITNPRDVAAAANAPVPAVAATGTTPAKPARPSLDGTQADILTKLGQLPSGPDSTYRSLIVTLGVQSSTAANNLTIQNVISGQVDAARESVAGVNLDEELTNMLQFQHAYSAASRLITSIDEMLDTVINRMGIVGR